MTGQRGTGSAAGAEAPVPEPLGFTHGLADAARAYPTLLRVGVSEVVAYRAEFLVWILTTNMPLVMLALWHAVAAEGPVGRFGQREFTPTTSAAGDPPAHQQLAGLAAVDGGPRRDAVGQAAAPDPPPLRLAADHLAAVPMRVLFVSPIVGVLFYTSWDRLVARDPVLLLILARRCSARGC